MGTRLRELRKSRKLTQEELAKELEVHQMTISQWERDAREPDIKTLKKIAEFFGVTVGYLVGAEQI